MNLYCFTLVVLMVLGLADPTDDKLAYIPGYSTNFSNRAYAGYLPTQSDQRSLHYIFLQSNKGINNSAPVILWLNGGPGCSSKIGFLHQISPYILLPTQSYSSQSNLTFNEWSWLNLTNLLFIDGPSGVGYSINNDSSYQYNDEATSKDFYYGLKQFFAEKFPEYANNTFYIAGESYAGKYIPDLVMRILNEGGMSVQGVLIGNGLMSWKELESSRVSFMIQRNFVDPKLVGYWERACRVDADSAGCRYFYERYRDLVYRIDQNNIYGECYGRNGSPQREMIEELSLRFSPFSNHTSPLNTTTNPSSMLFDGCSYTEGAQNYLKINGLQLRSRKTEDIKLCNRTVFERYVVSPQGSMNEMRAILGLKVRVYLYSGDWDDVIPFRSAVKNIGLLGLKQQGSQKIWRLGTGAESQHAGFIKNYSSLQYYLVKGAGHSVPMYKRESAYRMMENFIMGV